MRIDFVEIANFRKLRSTRVGFSDEKTVFVGANNSGKTSAMVALRYFLVERERKYFSLNDFTLSHWPAIDRMGEEWEKAKAEDKPIPPSKWDDLLPHLDVWLNVAENEAHFVQPILPTLDWKSGLLGVRLRFEPKDTAELQKEYLTARIDVANAKKAKGKPVGEKEQQPMEFAVSLWPTSLSEFLQRRLGAFFEVKRYVLDPMKCKDPEYGKALPQALAPDSEPLAKDPFKGLVRIDEISAQRGFGQDERRFGDEQPESGSALTSGSGRKLSEQLRRYYRKHLDPERNPVAEDLLALQAMEDAQRAFDLRLKEGFAAPIGEMAKLGYPGITDPKLSISTRLRPVDGLMHEAAVRYVIQIVKGEGTVDLHLPEDSNGLGYQNLISMVFKLMSFRDAWLRVKKAQKEITSPDEATIPPLHVVLVEEPEAHLHTQVQQVFIRQAYKILRASDDLKDSGLTTQLVVSTHSSHVAHECDFASLRYFRRLPAGDGEIPTSCVVNLTRVFGEEDETRRFVTRYLKVTHCDLFFADAAVLIEGPAERILVPYFVAEHAEFRDLSECYVTWLEIGGSHAHRLRDLIENLGLTTLIITDLDAVDETGKNACPQRGSKQKTRNATLKKWWPSKEMLDELLDLKEAEKELVDKARHFAIRVAYQCPVKFKFKDKDEEAVANTLEDALVYENLAFFEESDGKGLLTKFKNAINNSASVAELSQKLLNSLTSGGKAELGLDLLELKDANALKPPTYIREGLLWLAAQLRQNQKDLGLASPVAAEPKKAA